MTEATEHPGSFAYEAQSPDGTALSGTLEASDVDEARWKLQGVGLRVIELSPAEDRPARAKALRGEDFLAFNEQLAQLASAGLPLERGLRLIANDMRSRRLAETVRRIADEVERGRSLSEAFDAHREKFPPLYGQLVEAGVKTGNLHLVLLNLSRHVRLMGRLRETFWRAAAYPLVVLLALAVVAGLISIIIVPQFEQMYTDFDVELPAMTTAFFAAAKAAPYIAGGVLVIAAGLYGLWLSMWASGTWVAFLERSVGRVPIVGQVIRRHLIAIWCDHVRLGLQAGQDLPTTVEIAGHATGSPGLRHDSERIRSTLQQGRTIEWLPKLRILPPMVTVSMQLSAERGDLPNTMAGLSEMYRQQSEHRLGLLRAILPPIFVVVVGLLLLLSVFALLLPLMSFIQSVSF